MSHALLAQLERKVDEIIENFNLLKLQVDELEERNSQLQNQNQQLKQQETQWEHGLHSLLHKLEDIGIELHPTEAEVPV